MMQLPATARNKDGLEFPFTQEDFQAIAAIVYNLSGIVLAAHKRDMMYARLARRLRILGLRSFREYCALLHSSKGAQESGFLINAITTNLTRFFRESHHFEHLQKQVLPGLAAEASRERLPIRIWSAGCSSGEEPYSIAMCAMAAQQQVCSDRDLRILATDLDTSMLQKAKAGLYEQAALDDVPPRLRERYFEPYSRQGKADEVAVAKPVQSLVTFRQLNLLGPWPMTGRFDAVFCRNVMIYFDAKTKDMLIERFHAILKDGGWLYVGHSESLLEHQSRFQLCGRTLYRKKS
ncbi:MAG: CheR family methyltransferase [Rhodomicrobium sp.]